MIGTNPKSPRGYYNEDGFWVNTKRCFVYCGSDKCDCSPPGNQFYNPKHDKNNEGNINGTDPKVCMKI